jgi:hypothetical protein
MDLPLGNRWGFAGVGEPRESVEPPAIGLVLALEELAKVRGREPGRGCRRGRLLRSGQDPLTSREGRDGDGVPGGDVMRLAVAHRALGAQTRLVAGATPLAVNARGINLHFALPEAFAQPRTGRPRQYSERLIRSGRTRPA